MKLLIDRLNKKHKDEIEFKKASGDVFLGNVKLAPNTSHSFGKNVSISSADVYKADKTDLKTGKYISVGSIQKLKGGELRCYKKDDLICAGLFKDEKLIGMELIYSPSTEDDAEKLDEGYFTWFGPVEYIGTPWSDMDPEVCQIVTIEYLRNFGNKILPQL